MMEYENPPNEGTNMGPHRSVWMSSRMLLDLFSVEWKGVIGFFNNAHPLHIPSCLGLRLGRPFTNFSIEGNALKFECPSIVCKI